MNKQKIVSIIKRHLQDQNFVLVLKGFDSSIFQLVKDELLDRDILNGDGKIDLSRINPHQTMKNIMSIEKSGMMTMESMIALFSFFSNLDILGKEFCVLNNNLLSKYDNPSTTDIPDFEQSSFQKESGNDIYCNYYSYCEHVGERQLIDYVEPDISASSCVRTVEFLDSLPIDDIALQPDGLEVPELSFESGALQKLLENIYFDVYMGKKVFVLPQNKTQYDKYGVVLSAIRESGDDIALYWKKLKPHQTIVRKELYGVLQGVWGYDSFRYLKIYEDLDISKKVINVSQGEIIETVVSEVEKALKKSDFKNVLLTSPTGAGKSLLFQLSAIYIAEKYKALTIVISPLIALMDDQVQNLLPKYAKVAALNSGKTADEVANIMENVQKGNVNILYMSPELLLSHSINTLIGERRVGMVVIDEAHIVTTWGRDFRVDYWFLGDYLRTQKKYLGYNFPIFALTATAVWDQSRENDMVFETIDSLNMDPCVKYIGVVRRNNIVFEVGHPERVSDYEKQRRNRTVDGIVDAIEQNRKSIFYFPYIKHIGSILDMPKLQPYRNKITQFHSRLNPSEKQTNAGFFKDGTCPIICASKAFGMGVDVPDITEVYHHAPSGSLPDYVQEIGRLARDEKLVGVAKIDFNEQDFKYTRQLHGLSTIKPYQLEAVLKKLMELYRLRGEKRNMMISPADFAYIFQNADGQIDQNLKSCLLLISNDLKRKLHFQALIVRAKNLFVDTYIELPKEEARQFYNDYQAYLTPLEIGSGRYILHAERYWTDRQSSISFPQFKRNLMLQRVFSRYHVSPITRVDICLNSGKTVSTAKVELERFFDLSQQILDKLANPRRGDLRHIKYRDIRNKMFDGSAMQKEAFLRSFVLAYAPSGGLDERTAYCQVKVNVNEDENQVSLIRQGYNALKSQMISAFISTITDTENSKYCKKDDIVIFLAELLNSLNIASFQKVGGADSQVFVRINNPVYLYGLVRNGNYQNKMLEDIYRKHHFSEEVFTYFFSTDMTDKQRWDFIESYFLGASEDELLNFLRT